MLLETLFLLDSDDDEPSVGCDDAKWLPPPVLLNHSGAKLGIENLSPFSVSSMQ